MFTAARTDRRPQVRRSKINRAVGALVATAVIIAGCSSDDDDASPTTEAVSDTTEAAPETTEAVLQGEGLEIGLLTPSAGLLASTTQGQERGVAFAAADVDEAGGVLEGPLTVTNYPAEPGAEPTANVQAAVDGGAQALIGPAGSDIAEAVRDEVASLGSIACSPSATLPRITRDQETMSLFRTALPDDITTTYLTSAIEARRDAAAPGAAWNVVIVARTDEYGLSISNGLAATLEASGMAPTVVGYNARRVNFAGTAEQVAAAEPDLTVLVTYDEGFNLLSSLVSEGLDPASMIGLDAFFAPRAAEIATPGGDASVVDGFTLLGSMGNKAFLDRLISDDDTAQVSFAPQAYDCAVTLALATAAVDAGESATMAEAVVAVTAGGVTCTTYVDCLDKLNAGEDIDYDGVSGQLAIDENGDPTFGRFTSAVFSDGVITDVSSTDVDFAEIRRQQEAYAAAAQITKIQQALTFLGFYSGPINGLDTPEFRAALAAFQASVGLPPTGIFDEATDAALRAALGPYADLLSATTADIQRLMTDLGFYTGPIDGVWTEELTQAIQALQAELGVPQTGVLDAATLRAIYAAGQESGAATTTTVPTTTAPETTAPPTTAPPTTAPPTTAPPTTAPPTTAPETTLPPVDPTLPTLSEALRSAPEYSDYVRLLAAAAYPDDFDRLQAYTLFAPTNDALAEAGYDIDAIIADVDPTLLFQLLADTVALGRLELADLPDPIEMLSGNEFPVTSDGTTVTVNGQDIVGEPIRASNGIIHGLGSLAPR
jgi:branched-chain amino acid transport system substrate-binding protein